MARSRDRAKGRRGGETEHFARVPVAVLESEACRTLDHAALRVMLALACQYRGRNNGAMALTPRHAVRFGIMSKTTLYKSLRALAERGLIVETRQGWKGVRNHFALYALGWSEINNREGQPLQSPEPPNIRAWLDWRNSIPAAGNEKTERSTSHWTNSFPASGKEHAVSVPVTGPDPPLSLPASGKTSRYLGGDAQIERARLADAVSIARTAAGITAEDLAARARCRVEIAHAALQQLQAEVSP